MLLSPSLAASNSNRLRVCLASDYNDGCKLYNGLCFEACEAVSTMAQATIVAPEGMRHGPVWKAASKAKHALTGVPIPAARRQPVGGPFDLFFYICMRPDNLTFLNAMEGWRERSGKAVAFLFETWSLQAEHNRRYLRLLDQFDHVFLFNPQSVAAVQRHTSAKCSYLPAGVDCLAATPYPRCGPRPIDIYGMGRTVEAVHEQLIELTLQQKLLYIWDRGPGAATTGFHQARVRTYHFIRNSRLFTSFNFHCGSKIGESGGEEAIPARVFEGAAAGAVMIGSTPGVAEFERLFDWPDALIEIPMDPLDMAAFYADLEKQPERIRRTGILNAAQSLRRHDWAYRWEEILRIMDLPVPSAVEERKARLGALADLAEASL